MARQKLLTKAIERKLPRLYETEEIPTDEKVVQVKFFCITNGWTWYGVEYDPEEKNLLRIGRRLGNRMGLFLT